MNVSRAKNEVEIFTMDKQLLFKSALRDDKQVDSITFENRNYKNYSIVENILNGVKKVDMSIPSMEELRERFNRENSRKEYIKPKTEKKIKIEKDNKKMEKDFTPTQKSETEKIKRKMGRAI